MFAPLIAKTKAKTTSATVPNHAPKTGHHIPGQPAGSLAEWAALLQRTIGNQATLRLLAQRSSRPSGTGSGEQYEQANRTMRTPEPQLQRVCACGGGCPKCQTEQSGQEHERSQTKRLQPGNLVSWNFAKIPVLPPDRSDQPQARSLLTAPPLLGSIQPKFIVGQIDDPLEREADRVAEAVVSGRAAPSTLQRKCAACENEEERAMRKAAGPGLVADATPAAAVPSLGAGTPLPATVRATMEPRFGWSFADVRIHTGAEAAASATALNAHAYTLGSDIAFAPGQYRPYDRDGQRLLAHELVHVVQQRDSKIIRRQPSPIDAQAQELINLAQNSTRELQWRAHELVWRMLQKYFPNKIDMVIGTSYVSNLSGLMVVSHGSGATTTVTIQ